MCVCVGAEQKLRCVRPKRLFWPAQFFFSNEVYQHLLISCTNYFYVTKTKPNPFHNSHKTFPGTTYKIGTLFTNSVITNTLFKLHGTTLLQD
jgi:hypothetical protein